MEGIQPPTEQVPSPPHPTELSEEERTQAIETSFRQHGRYVDGTQEHRAALNLIEERNIVHFTNRQHLFKVLYHLTDPSPTKARPTSTPVGKTTPPPPPAMEPLKEHPRAPLIPLPIIDSPQDIGGEGGP